MNAFSDAQFKSRTAISISPDLLARGQKRARQLRRSFSNYIEVLIEADVRQSPAVDVPTMNGESLKAKSVRLSQEQIEALEHYAVEDKRDVSQVIRIALDEFLERQRDIEQKAAR